MANSRPLVVVMVADPTPLTLTNLRQVSEWADLILTEGTMTIGASPREPLRSGWRELLDAEPPHLRVITTDLAGEEMWQRERIQRNSVLPVLTFESDDRIVIMLDSDEFLEPDAVFDAIDAYTEPVRLGLVPIYAGVDRVARSIHCCWHESYAVLRDPSHQVKRPYIVAAPSVSRVGEMRASSPSAIRFRSPIIDRERTFGTHVTMTASAVDTAWKLRNMRERWVPRVCDERHLDTMLRAGVHHAGWWITEHRDPEPWLRELAQSADLRVVGDPLPEPHLRALRAWSEARLDPLVPDVIVEAGDAYVAERPTDAHDVLAAIDSWQLSSDVRHVGRELPPDECMDHAEEAVGEAGEISQGA
jgi:hypothetical protein